MTYPHQCSESNPLSKRQHLLSERYNRLSLPHSFVPRRTSSLCWYLLTHTLLQSWDWMCSSAWVPTFYSSMRSTREGPGDTAQSWCNQRVYQRLSWNSMNCCRISIPCSLEWCPHFDYYALSQPYEGLNLRLSPYFPLHQCYQKLMCKWAILGGYHLCSQNFQGSSSAIYGPIWQIPHLWSKSLC